MNGNEPLGDRLFSYLIDDALEAHESKALVDLDADEARASSALVAVHMLCTDLLSDDEPSDAAIDLAAARARYAAAQAKEFPMTTQTPPRSVRPRAGFNDRISGALPSSTPVASPSSKADLSASGTLPAERPESGGENFSEWLSRRLGMTPWWVTSCVVHALIMFLAMLIIIRQAQPTDSLELSMPTRFVKEDPPRIYPPDEKFSTEVRAVNLRPLADRTLYVLERLEVPDESEVMTETEMVSEWPTRGSAAVSSIPAEGRGVIGVFGTGGSRGRARLA